MNVVKLRHYEKAKKLKKSSIIPVLTKQLFLLSSVKTIGRFFQIFVAFLENLSFNVKIIKMYMIFVTEFVFLGKNLHTEVRINSFPHGRISEIFFLAKK